MDCHQAQAQLEFERLGQDAVRSSDALAAERHLAECEVCRAVVRSERQFDSQVTRAMRDVPVPTGLANRLHAAVGPATVAVEPPVTLPRRRMLRRLGWSSVALVPMLVLGAVLVSRSAVLNDASIRELGRQDVNLLPVGSTGSVTAPAAWRSQRAIQLANAPQVATVNRVEVPLLAFTARTDRRSASCTGFLIKLPLSRWHQAPEADSFSTATIQYAAFGTWVVWREGDEVVICILQADAHAMQRLQDLVDAGRQLT